MSINYPAGRTEKCPRKHSPRHGLSLLNVLTLSPTKFFQYSSSVISYFPTFRQLIFGFFRRKQQYSTTEFFVFQQWFYWTRRFDLETRAFFGYTSKLSKQTHLTFKLLCLGVATHRLKLFWKKAKLCPSSSFPLHSHHTSSQSICQQQWRNV